MRGKMGERREVGSAAAELRELGGGDDEGRRMSEMKSRDRQRRRSRGGVVEKGRVVEKHMKLWRSCGGVVKL